MPRRMARRFKGRRPPERSLQFAARSCYRAIADFGLAAQPMRQGAQKRIAVDWQQRLASVHDHLKLTVGYAERTRHWVILPRLRGQVAPGFELTDRLRGTLAMA